MTSPPAARALRTQFPGVVPVQRLNVNGFQFPFKSGVGSLPVALTG